jgi:IS5 family transposase
MSHQLTFADSEFSTKRRQTRKEIFSPAWSRSPWQNMTAVIEPFYPKAGNGRRPYPLETMLRIHCMQHWYNLSDGAMEDALYEIASMRLFARLSLDSALPDRTTIMNFRHLLEQHQLARQLFKTINRWLAEAGVMMTQGTLVDATIIEAPSSTKNNEQQRDPEMHQTKKGNQWHFGMKAHIVSMPRVADPTTSPPRPTSMTSISWVICFMERSNLSSRCRLLLSATARGAGRGGCGPG